MKAKLKTRSKTLISALMVLLVVSMIPVSAQMTPTLDGVISPGEWGEVDFTVIGNEWHMGYEVYVQNDLDYLYIAFVDQPGADYAVSGGTSICIYLGDDYAGKCWVYEPSGPGWSTVLTYYTTHHIQPPIVTEGEQPISTNSVVEVGLNVMEWKIPLDEFSAKPGDTIAFDLYSYMDGFTTEETTWLYEVYYTLPTTVDLTVTVVGEPPVAIVSATVDYMTVTFDGSDSYDPDGKFVSYSWDFGDGSPIETVSTPIHKYSVEGTYTVNLTVTDNDGLTDSAFLTVKATRRRVIILRNINPNANAGRNRRVHVGEIVKFSGVNSTDPDGTIVSYGWDFGDGAEASGVNASHRYLMADNYTVTLTVVDNKYGEDTDTCTITVIEEIIIPPPLPPYLDNLNITPEELELGDNVTISFDIRNFDSQHITYGVDIYVEDVNVTRIWVDLGAYEFKTVSHTITPDTVGIYSVAVHGMTGSFTVEAPEIPLRPAEFEVTDMVITPEEVEPGDEVTISVLVTNIGEETGDYTVTLDLPAGPFLRLQETVSLEGGESERVEFEVSRDIEGIYDVTVDGLTGSFTVKSPEPPLRPAEFVVSGLIASPDEAEAGEEITMMVEVENIGEEMGTHTIQFNVDGSFTDLPEITLDGGESTTVTFTIIIEVAGEHTVSVEALTEVITVTAPPSGISVAYYAGVTIIIVVAGVIIFLTLKGKFPSIYTKPE